MKLLFAAIVIYTIFSILRSQENGSPALSGFLKLFRWKKKRDRAKTWGGGGAGSSKELSRHTADASGKNKARVGSGKQKYSSVPVLLNPETRERISTLSGCDAMRFEDREHDWLAEQLREEQRSYLAVSAMFEAKLSHMLSCSAESLRLSHSSACDAEELRKDSRHASGG